MIARTLVATAGGIVSLATVSACTAHADPPPFPDLSGYSPVDPAEYAVTYPNSGRPTPLEVMTFRTPDGIVCAFGNPPSAGCSGKNLPGIAPASPSSSGSPRVNAISTVVGPHPTGDTSDTEGHPVKTLPPNHSITVDGVICGVNGSGMTACKDSQGRGFILSPQWSGWLPHV